MDGDVVTTAQELMSSVKIYIDTFVPIFVTIAVIAIALALCSYILRLFAAPPDLDDPQTVEKSKKKKKRVNTAFPEPSDLFYGDEQYAQLSDLLFEEKNK